MHALLCRCFSGGFVVSLYAVSVVVLITRFRLCFLVPEDTVLFIALTGESSLMRKSKITVSVGSVTGGLIYLCFH